MPWSLILPFLKSLLERVLDDPVARREAQQQLAELDLRVREAEAQAEAAREQAFADFIAATQPSASRVYVLFNSLIALVRPAMAVFVLVSLVVYTEKWKEILTTLASAGIWGAIGISPLLVWVLGRDGLRLVFGAMGVLKGGGVPPEAVPPGIPSAAPATPPVAPRPPVTVAPRRTQPSAPAPKPRPGAPSRLADPSPPEIDLDARPWEGPQ